MSINSAIDNDKNETEKDKRLIKKLNEKNIFTCDLSNKLLTSNLVPLKYNNDSHANKAPHLYISSIDDNYFMIKICFYTLSVPELYINIPKVISHSETEIRILRELKHLLNEGYLRSIVRLIYTKTCNNIETLIEDPANCMNNNISNTFAKTLCSYNFRVKSGLALPRCSFIALELCDITFGDFLEKYIHTSYNFAILKGVLFQVIYTLYVLSEVYPQFHHYDLHSDNIMLKFTKYHNEDKSYYEYHVDGRKYYVPQYDIKVKIIDFEFASIPEIDLISAATKDRLIMFQRPENDIILTLFWINHTLRAKSAISDDILNLLKEIEPNETYLNFNMQYVRSVESKIPSYKKMLKITSFKHYQANIPDNGAKIIKIKDINGYARK